MSESIYRIENLSKIYADGTEALKKVSLNIPAGEFVTLVGASGSGKSTLLRSLNRMIEPTAGDIVFEGQSITGLPTGDMRLVRRKMAMIFQQFNLIPRTTVLTNVLLGRLGVRGTVMSILGRWSESDKSEALKFLNVVGIADKAGAKVEELSGGQQQRVAIARALMQNPRVILADEPVASLDPATARTVMTYLKKINRDLGITVVCSLHFLDLVREFSTRVVALKAGELVFQGPPSDLTDTWYQNIYGEREPTLP